MRGVVDGGCAVHHGHAATAEFLVGRAGGAAVPEADGDAGAAERVGRGPQEVGSGGNGGIDIFGDVVKRLIALEGGDFLDSAVGQHGAQRQAHGCGAGAGVLAAGVFDFGHPRDDAGAIGGAR